MKRLLHRLQSRWTHLRLEVLHHETRNELRDRLQHIPEGLRLQIEQHRAHIELLAAERDALRAFVQKQKGRIEEMEMPIPAETVPWCVKCSGPIKRGQRYDVVTIRHHECTNKSNVPLGLENKEALSQARPGDPFHLPATTPEMKGLSVEEKPVLDTCK